MKSKNRRRNYFVEKKFQTHFFIKFALLLVLESVLIAALFTYISKGTLTAAYRGTAFTIQKTSSYFFMDFIVIALIVGSSIGLAGGIVFMYLSHRIGGALYKFEKVLEDAERGNFAQRVSLRKTDELKELQNRLNSFLEVIDRYISRLKGDVEKGLTTVERYKDDRSLSKARETLKNIKSSLDNFKTSK